MASLETDIKGFDRIRTIVAMLLGKRIEIHFEDKVIFDAIKRAPVAESNVQPTGK